MENFGKELLKWAEAPKEIEEEAHEMLQRRHRLGYTCIVVLGYILMGIAMFKLGQIDHKASSVFIKVCLNFGAIICMLGGITIGCSYIDDGKYLKGKGIKEKVRVKTVLLHEVIIKNSGGRHPTVYRYFKISYPMGDETVIRDLSDSKLHYDTGLLGLDLVGLYGKKITIAYCNKEFYILNHVYPQYDDEEIKGEGQDIRLKSPETAVRNLVESRDEGQIKKKKLQEELQQQISYKLWKYCSRIFIVIGGVVLSVTGIHGGWGVVVGGEVGIFLALRFAAWLSCKKHSGEIWDRAKMRKVQKELDAGTMEK